MTQQSLPSHASAVIVGGGVIGCSIAYHLAKLGWSDVLLLERSQLGCGTTWHAAGLVTTLRDTEAQTELARYSLALYATLEAETGQATGFNRCGSIQLAMDIDKREEMLRGCTLARSFGVESHVLTPGEVRELFPLARVDDLEAGFYFPGDGRVNPADVTQALARGARRRGATIREHTPVDDVLFEHGRAVGVRTPHGDVRAEAVVLCPGMWARELGLRCGIDLPLQAMEHYYLVSEAVDGMHAGLPILRDPGRSCYVREETGKILLGFFEPVGKPWALDGIPRDFCFDEIQPDWERMEPWIERGMQRVPVLLETGIRKFFCGPESFTPDHNYLMGRVPYRRNLFVACGFNSLGVVSAGGAGDVMARWINDGVQPIDVWDVDVRRVHPVHNNRSYVLDRAAESLGISYQMHWPHRQWETARGLRRSVLHDRVAAAGACFGESAGWERPNWYARPGQPPRYQYAFGRQNWFDNAAAEHRAVREAVGLFDQSSFAKLLVQGRDTLGVLDALSTAALDVPVGKVVYTHFLNVRGGVEADLTITRLAETRFLIVTPAFTATQVEAWIEEHTGESARCTIADVTGAWCVLNVQGPRSRDLLARVSRHDVSSAAFAYATMQRIEIGYQHALAMRVSYSGELGFELYVPSEMATAVYDAVLAAGADLGLRLCGFHALDSLRIEKGFRSWAHDMGPCDSLLEAGLGFTCAWDKPGGFIGRDALRREREAGPPARRLVQFVLDDPEPVLDGHEAILRDGELVGQVTSAAYAHTLGASVALGYVRARHAVDASYIAVGGFQIEQADRRYIARASLEPLYDARAARMRG